MSKKINNTKKIRIINFLKKIPFILYIILMLASLVAAALLVYYIVIQFSNKSLESQIYVQLLIGLAATVLSIIIAINGIVSTIINKINSAKEIDRQNTLALSNFIDSFNANYLLKVNRILSLIKMSNGELKISFDFEPSLKNQKKKVAEIDKILQENSEDYLSTYLYFCSITSYMYEGCFSKVLLEYCKNIIKDKRGGKNISHYRNEIGGSEILRFYRKERIDILNFFENIAILYFNNNLNRLMVDAQFKPMLEKIIPQFYYFIYKDEGVNCYPYLNMMLQNMF